MVTLPRCQQTLCCAACVQSSSKQLLMAVGLYSRNTKAAWVPSRPTAVPRPWAPFSWPQSMLPSLYPMPGAEAAPTPPKVNTIHIYHHCNLPPGPTSHQAQLWGEVGDNTPFGPDGENLILHIQASKSWPFSPASLEAFHTQVFQVWGEKSSTSMSYLSPLDCQASCIFNCCWPSQPPQSRWPWHGRSHCKETKTKAALSPSRIHLVKFYSHVQRQQWFLTIETNIPVGFI